MSRPRPRMSLSIRCRRLPLLACAVLGIRVNCPAQTQAGSSSNLALPRAGGIPVTGAEDSSLSSLSPAATARGFLGVNLGDVRPEVRAQTVLKEGEGLQICKVIVGSPAYKGGVQPFDILLRFNDQLVISEKQVATLVENAGPGCEVELTVLRKGKEQRLQVSLCNSPKPEERANLVILPQLPPREEMLRSMVNTFHENPTALETVWRMFHGPLTGAPDAVTEIREQTSQRFALWDEGGQVELTQTGPNQRLRAWDEKGHLIFEGPCQTPQQRAEIPADALVRLELLEKRRRAMGEHQVPAPTSSAASAAPAPLEVKTPQAPGAKP